MGGFGDLAREYEARHFPPTRRLDVHAEGAGVARDRALRWIQSFAHEAPGQELLLVVERGRLSRRRSPVRAAIEGLLDELEGKLIDWWQLFGEGSIAVRVAEDPTMRPVRAPAPPDPRDEGRTPETAGAGLLEPQHDIPAELLELAERAAELRRSREGLSVGVLDVVLRRVWIQAQADAMNRRVGFEAALERILDEERERAADEI